MAFGFAADTSALDRAKAALQEAGAEARKAGQGARQYRSDLEQLGRTSRDVANDTGREAAATTAATTNRRRARTVTDEMNRALDAMARNTRQATGATTRQTVETAQLSRAQSRATTTTEAMNASLARMSSMISMLRTGLIGLGAGLVIRSLTNVATGFQRMGVTLQFATGSIQAAQEEIAWLRQEADRLGQNIITSGQSFAKLAASATSMGLGMEQVRKIFTGVGSAAAVMGLNAYEAEGAFLALQQMLAKGTVQAEELRGQLGERIPTAFADAATAMGMTTAELSKALDLGQVKARDFVMKLSDLWVQKFGAAIPDATESTQKAIQELDNAFDLLKLRVVESGFLEGLTASMQALTQALASDGVGRAADALGLALQQLGEGFAGMIQVAGQFAGAMGSILGPLLSLVDAFDGLTILVAALVARHMAPLIASLTTTTAMTARATAAFLAGRASLLGWASAAGGATVAARGLSLALVGARGLVGVLGGPLGIALTGAVTAFALLSGTVETGAERAKDYAEEMDLLAGRVRLAAGAQDELARSTESATRAMIEQGIEKAKVDRTLFEGDSSGALARARTFLGQRSSNLGLQPGEIELLFRAIESGSADAARELDRLSFRFGNLGAQGLEAKTFLQGTANELRAMEDAVSATDLRVAELESQLLGYNAIVRETGATQADTRQEVNKALQDFIEKLEEEAEKLRTEEAVFGKSAGAAVKYRLTQEALAFGLDKLPPAQQEIITLLIEEIAARENSLEALQEETKARQALETALEKDVELRAKAIAAQRSAAEQTTATVEQLRGEASALRQGAAAYELWQASQARAAAVQKAFNDVLQEYPEQLQGSSQALQQAAASAREVGQAYDDLANARQLAKWREANEAELKKLEAAAADTAGEIKSVFADALNSLFGQGERGFGAMLRSWLNSFRRAMIEIVTDQGFQVLASALSGSGGSASAARSSASATSAISNASSVGNLLGLFRSGAGFGSNALNFALQTFPETSVSLGLGQVSMASGGLPQPIIAPTAFGNTLAAGVNAAPWGVLGSLAANAFGLAPQNEFVGFGASTIGSIGGGIAGTAALGTLLGSAAGPVGAVIGAFAANALASQFGPRASVGPNATASLGFDGGQFTVGARGQDNGGDSSQWAAGIQQVAGALNQIMAATGIRVANPGQSMWRFGLGAGGGAPFGTDPQALLAQVLTSGIFTADDPNIRSALSRTGGSAEQIAADLEFAARFEDAITGMRRATLDYASVLEVQARDAVQAQTDQITAFLETAERLGLNTAEATAAAGDFVRVMIGVKDAAPPLTEVEAAFEQLRIQSAELGPLLQAVGVTAEEAAAGFETLRERIRTSVRRGWEAELNQLNGLGALNTVSELVQRRDLELRNAAAAGLPTSMVEQLFGGRLAEALSGQTVTALNRVIESFGTIPGVAQAVTAAMAQAQAEAQAQAAEAVQEQIATWQGTMQAAHAAAIEAAREQLSAYQATAQETQQLATAMRGFADRLRETRLGLLTGDLSTLGPQARLQELGAQFAALSASARLGDQDALSELPQLARTYLEAAREYHEATEPYAAIFNEVQAALEAAEGTADRQAGIAEQQLSAAQEQVRLLQEMVDRMQGSTGSGGPLAGLVQALAGGGDLTQALAGLNATQLLSALQMTAPGSAQQEQIRRFIGASGTGFGPAAAQAQIQEFMALGQQAQAGTFQGDVLSEQLRLLSTASPQALAYFLKIMNPNGANTAAARAFLEQYGFGGTVGDIGITHPIPGFAEGGNTMGQLARVHRDEWLYTGPPTQVVNSTQMQAAMASARPDMGPVVTELERQTVYMRQGFQRLWQEQQRTNERLDDIERRLRVAA